MYDRDEEGEEIVSPGEESLSHTPLYLNQNDGIVTQPLL
jgi:hypothetical protein